MDDEKECDKFYSGLKKNVQYNRELTREKMHSMGISVPSEWKERNLAVIASTTNNEERKKALNYMTNEERKHVIGNKLISHDKEDANTTKLNFFEKVVPFETPMSPSHRTKTQMRNRHKLINLAADGETQLTLFRPLIRTKPGTNAEEAYGTTSTRRGSRDKSRASANLNGEDAMSTSSADRKRIKTMKAMSLLSSFTEEHSQARAFLSGRTSKVTTPTKMGNNSTLGSPLKHPFFPYCNSCRKRNDDFVRENSTLQEVELGNQRLLTSTTMKRNYLF